MAVKHLITAEQLERIGKQDYSFELVRGELVPVTPAGREQGILAGFLTVELGMFARERELGRVYVAETGFTLQRNPDTVRAPDVSFVRRERDAALRSRRGFVPGAPDLAIEIRSPDNALAKLATKAGEYLMSGGRLVWIVDPMLRQVHVHRPRQAVIVLSSDATLDGGDVLPGFALPLSRLFAELD